MMQGKDCENAEERGSSEPIDEIEKKKTNKKVKLGGLVSN